MASGTGVVLSARLPVSTSRQLSEFFFRNPHEREVSSHRPSEAKFHLLNTKGGLRANTVAPGLNWDNESLFLAAMEVIEEKEGLVELVGIELLRILKTGNLLIRRESYNVHNA